MKISRILTILFALTFPAIAFSQKAPKNYGKIDTRLFLTENPKSHLLVAFGGSEGGNTFASEKTASVRTSFMDRGFHVMAIGNFGSKGLPKYLDRISLDAIYDTIAQTAERLNIPLKNVILLGASRGGELVLNLASNYEFKGAIAMVPSNIIVPYLGNKTPTSSWVLNEKPLEYFLINESLVEKKGWAKAVKSSLVNQDRSDNGIIKVENSKGFIILTSGKEDDSWPSSLMCRYMIVRLQNKGFEFPYKHLEFDGGHKSSTHFPKVFELLDEWLVSSKE